MAKILVVKVKETNHRNNNALYRNKIPIDNPRMIAILLSDLEAMFNAPVKKACSILFRKEETFPI